jgi:hypothetical protein
LFHGFPYFGRSNAVSSVDSHALVADLNRMFTSKPEVAWACELPRHAVRLRTTASEMDVLVSFECGNLEIFDAKGDRLVSRSIEGGDQKLWYAVFQRSGIERQSYPYRP